MSDYIIPKLPELTAQNANIVIQSFGLGAVKTAVYKAGMPASKGQGKSYGVSKLGTPVFSNLDIAGFSYTDQSGKKATVPDIKFETVLFVVNQQKEMLKTVVQGRNTSVKEYICDGDYAVQIMGVLTADNRNFPMQDTSDLISLLKAPLAFKVNSWYLDLFGINNLVVESYQIGQEEGGYCYQKFNIQCLSDSPIELQIVQ